MSSGGFRTTHFQYKLMNVESTKLENSTIPPLLIANVCGSFYEIIIHKSDSEIINEYMFSPKIVKFVDSTSICCYVNFPHNWANWRLPKRLHKKDLKIVSFDKMKIVVGW
jgi:hypothetical protein